ncbi:unnamed protein product [Didymodactylos carnosus]|uniref:MICOS complex subunit MIC60 n=1 Tax=Didymodactylos carnosus TaxID=1234261 RepID=A0A813ZZ56_9BILA|nr:unnamed protein product [Didymodactylos carnosus]CAF0943988.1 unnamed protein product [Didymodactylos carnosus]CAF3687192.1 unnamed protein product [Didymodactylos carnosus]CAF3718693.1 unnamed protein product [Didymodactylos carnosus]
MLRVYPLNHICPRTTTLALIRHATTTPSSSSTTTTSSASSSSGNLSTNRPTTPAASTSTIKPTNAASTTYSTSGSSNNPLGGTSSTTGSGAYRTGTSSGTASGTYSSGSSQGSSSGSGALKWTAITLLTATTGVIAYAEYDSKFRRSLENSVPFSSQILSGVDQIVDPLTGRNKSITTRINEKLPDLAYVKEKVPDAKTAKDTLSSAQKTITDTVTTVKDKLPDYKTVKDNLSSAQKTITNTVSTAKDKIESAATTVKDLPKTKGTSGEKPAKMADPMFIEEPGVPLAPPPITVENYKKLEEELNKMYDTIKDSSHEITKSAEKTLASVQEHTKHMKQVMEKKVEEVSDDVWKKGEELQKQASSAYDKTISDIDSWKKQSKEYGTKLEKYGSDTKQTSKDVYNKLSKDMKDLEEQIEGKFKELHSSYQTSSFVSKFKSYIDDATKSFQKEIETMFPSLAKKSPTNLDKEDLQALLAHAHKKIAKLHQDISKMKTVEKDTVDAALLKAKAEVDTIVEQRVQEKLADTTRQLSLELKQYEEILRRQFDEQLKREIVLQHSALTQYLSDILSRQYDEWTKTYEKKLDEETLNVRLNIQHELYQAFQRVQAIETAIDQNHDAELKAKQAQKLWIQAQNILNTIVSGEGTEHLNNDIDTILQIVPDERFVQVLVSELKLNSSTDALHTSEDSLRERFQRVKTLCKRLSMVDQNHHSLMTYILSYLQSLFIIHPRHAQKYDENEDETTLDLSHLSTFSILNYVQNYIDHDQWLNALRLIQLLRGEARQCAQSWIQDTQQYLAQKQTSKLLEAYSNSIGLGTLPRHMQQ